MHPPRVEQTVKTFLAMTAAIEIGAGVSLAAAPSTVALVLLGTPLASPAGRVLGRLLGAALWSLGMACWLARADPRSRAARGLIAAMLLYNVAATSLLGHADFGLGLSGVVLRPAILLHSAMAIWCLACLRGRSREGDGWGRAPSPS